MQPQWKSVALLVTAPLLARAFAVPYKIGTTVQGNGNGGATISCDDSECPVVATSGGGGHVSGPTPDIEPSKICTLCYSPGNCPIPFPVACSDVVDEDCPSGVATDCIRPGTATVPTFTTTIPDEPGVSAAV